MTFHTYVVQHFPKLLDGSWSSSPYSLTNIISINVSFNGGDSADIFTLNIKNLESNDFEGISVDDRIKIYGCLDGMSSSSLIIDGIVNEKQNSQTVDNSIIKISGLNRLEKLFNALVSTTGESIPHTASYWVKNIIDQVNLFNKLGGTNREITYDSNSIPDTPESIVYIRNITKAFTLIEELAQPKYTGNGNYVYYLDENNKFYFIPRSDALNGELTYGKEIKSHVTNKGMYDIVNYLIMNGGDSLYGTSILQLGYNIDSVSKYGWKVKLVNESIASDLLTSEIKRQRALGVAQDDSPFPSSYDYTTSWGVTVSSDNEYNSEFVDEVLLRAQNKIEELLSKGGSPTYKNSIEMVTASFDYALYQNYNLIIPYNGYNSFYNWNNGVALRINTVAYNFTNSGWKTSINFEQDTDKTDVGV